MGLSQLCDHALHEQAAPNPVPYPLNRHASTTKMSLDVVESFDPSVFLAKCTGWDRLPKKQDTRVTSCGWCSALCPPVLLGSDRVSVRDLAPRDDSDDASSEAEHNQWNSLLDVCSAFTNGHVMLCLYEDEGMIDVTLT